MYMYQTVSPRERVGSGVRLGVLARRVRRVNYDGPDVEDLNLCTQLDRNIVRRLTPAPSWFTLLTQ